MRIGIDARFLTHQQSGGFKTYTSNLIEAIGGIDAVNQYVIYLDRTPSVEMVLPQSDNFTYKVVPLRVPGVGMLFREQIDLPSQIRKDDLDLVHFPCNTAPVNITDKYVVTLHDVIQVNDTERSSFRVRRNLNEQKQWALTAYSRWAILKTAAKARKLLTVSNYEKEQISRCLDIPSERITVTYLAPGTDFKPMKRETKDAVREQVCAENGICGRFIMAVGYEPRKNIPLLIRSFANIAVNDPDLSLVVIAANSDKQQHFRQLASEQGLGERVHILGKQSSEELAVLYNLAEVFVFPSERESFGLPPLEAISCGTPTVVMNGSSLPEVLGNGSVYVDGANANDWAMALLSVIENPELRASLSLQGLERAEELSWRRCAEQTVNVYQMVHMENCSGN